MVELLIIALISFLHPSTNYYHDEYREFVTTGVHVQNCQYELLGHRGQSPIEFQSQCN